MSEITGRRDAGRSLIFNGLPENPTLPAPLWKINKRTLASREQAMQEHMREKQPELELVQVQWPSVLVDAVTVGDLLDGKQKPLIRHLLVKNLNKLAAQKKLQFPAGGVFKHNAPVGLYAIFDGLSCAGTPDPTAAEFCARNFHNKLIMNLADLPPEGADQDFVKTALIKSFQDLDADVLSNKEVQGGCGAAVALLVGEVVFSATLGPCSIVGAKVSDGELRAVDLGASQVSVSSMEQHFRSLGDREWKGVADGSIGPGLVTCKPDVSSMTLDDVAVTQPFVILAASSVASMLSASRIIELAKTFFLQPRATCGEIAESAQEASTAAGTYLSQFTVVQACFFDAGKNSSEGLDKKSGAPPLKKAKTGVPSKTGIESVRLRHILLKFNEKGQSVKPADAKGQAITRTRQEAETILRRVMKELQKQEEVSKKKPKDAKFVELCKQHSDCASAQKGGAMCGDLGWLKSVDLSQLGGNIKDNVDALNIGQWSDVTSSEQGLHLIQRIA